jgi:hypothetical protein
MTAKCREGHDSTELDYCSVCGAAMPVGGGASTRTSTSTSGGASCPQCGEPKPEPDARFCEVCRYDFVSRVPGPPPAARAAPPPPAPAPAPAPVPVPVPVADPPKAKWDLVLTIDATLDEEPDPAVPPPKDPERIFPVELPEMLVGRRDDKQNIRPAIPLNDPGASRRHARFLLQPDGTVVLHDLASMNGTKLNGEDVVSGSQRPLVAGDKVTLGRWSRIELRARA